MVADVKSKSEAIIAIDRLIEKAPPEAHKELIAHREYLIRAL